MARKSRKETAAVAVQEADAACRAAIYVRLSVEDTHTHSVSIETQQMIIARYLEQYPEISVYDTYIDNGATGTNFHRPGFQQMLSDIEAGHVNCVIVKDLSRLGRNTIDTGYYIEQYFRIRSIRFIAVNENFDTANPEDAHSGMLADMLQDALDTALGQYTLSLAELPRQAAERAELREKITSRKQEIQRLRGIVRSLYESLVQGVLTKDEYFDYKEKYESRIADLAVEMEQLEDGLRTMDTQIEQHRALEQDAAQIKTDRALTGALIERLIDRIEVSHDKQITVRYRFQSEFETYAEVLEQCRNM